MTAKKKHDAQKKKVAEKKHQDDLLDKALMDTFPTSDPIQLTEPAPKKEEDEPSYPDDEQHAPGP
jgi:hypothetical protein